MPYRIFRHNRSVTDRIDRYEAGASISDDEIACAEVAEALGADVGAIAAEHVDVVPAVSVVIPPQPSRPPPPFETLTAAEAAALDAPTGPLATLKAILSKPDADITAGEVKTVVLIMARYFLRKFLGGWR